MKKYCFLALLAGVLLLFSACRDASSVRMSLKEAETLMNERPDSALCLLRKINVEELGGKAQRAEYSLLMSMALDKNAIDLTSDSLINIATDYFRNHNDYEKRFLSLYYQGRVYENDKQYSKAMLSFTEAEQIMDNVDNDFVKGLLYAHLGDLNDKFYNYQKHLMYYIKAESFYSRANCITHVYCAKASQACAYINLNQYANAKDALEDVLTWSQENDTSLYYTCINLLGLLSKRTGDLSDYLMYSKGELEIFLPVDQSVKAYQYAIENDKEKSLHYLDLAWEAAENFQDTISMYDCSYRVNKRLGYFETALSNYEKLTFLQDTIIRSAIQQPLLEAQRDFFHSQAENQALILKNNKILSIGGCVIAVLILILIMVYYRHRLVQKQRNLDDYIALFQELSDKLSEKDSEIDNVHTQVRSLFSNHYELLNRLCQIYYENPGSSRINAIYSKVAKEIDSFKSDRKFYAELEKIVNEYNNDIISKLKHGMPKLSSQDYRTFCFFCAGFSPKSISLFTDEPIAHIYVRKMRLKEKIMKKKPADWQELIMYLK